MQDKYIKATNIVYTLYIRYDDYWEEDMFNKLTDEGYTIKRINSTTWEDMCNKSVTKLHKRNIRTYWLDRVSITEFKTPKEINSLNARTRLK